MLAHKPYDLTFLDACRDALVGRWFETAEPGGNAFRVKAIYMLGLAPQATIEFGLAGSKSGNFYALFNDLVDGKIVPLGDEPEEDSIEF